MNGEISAHCTHTIYIQFNSIENSVLYKMENKYLKNTKNSFTFLVYIVRFSFSK